MLDFKNKTLRPHASVPAPPPKADTTLVVYLSNNADPSQSKQAVLGGRAILGMQTATAKPRAGCAKLPDGRSSAYCWTLNWNEFGGARNGVPLLFPGAELSSSTYVQPVAYGAVVDVVLINPGTMVHPMHLHGQRFWVLGAGNGDILTADGKLDYSKLNPNSKRAIMRDTQPVANAVPGTAQPARKKMAVMSAATAPAMPGMGAAPGRRLKQGMADMADSMEPAVKPPPMSNMGARQQPKATKPAVRAAPMPGATDGMAGMPAAAAGNTPKADASAGDGMRGMEAAAPSSLTPGYTVIRFKANNPGEDAEQMQANCTDAQHQQMVLITSCRLLTGFVKDCSHGQGSVPAVILMLVASVMIFFCPLPRPLVQACGPSIATLICTQTRV